jgi:DeoR family glycerol-3-phosphate regulon repressor
MDYNEAESALRRALLAQSREAVILVDSSKFGRTAYVRTFGLEEIKRVVSDRLPPVPLREAFSEREVQLLTG